MITGSGRARESRAERTLLFAALVMLGATGWAQTAPSYQIIAPDIVARGEEFTIRIVDADQTPIPKKGTEIEFSGVVLPEEDGGKVRVPGFAKEGTQVLEGIVVEVESDKQKLKKATVPQRLEVLRLPQPSGQLPSKLWRISELSPSGSDVRVDGQALNGLKNARLQGASSTYPLTDSVGSSLQIIYRCPADLPKGSYHFVADDASGQRVQAPNETKNPTLRITGDQIRRRGQRGKITVLSDVDGEVMLSGGEPIIQLDQRALHVTPNKADTVHFKALQVGEYKIRAALYGPEVPPANAPRAEANVGKPQAHFNASDGKTSVSAPITVTDEQGKPIANTSIDVALVEPHGVEYNRLTTDKNGHAIFAATLAGEASADVLALHCFRILGHQMSLLP